MLCWHEIQTLRAGRAGRSISYTIDFFDSSSISASYTLHSSFVTIYACFLIYTSELGLPPYFPGFPPFFHVPFFKPYQVSSTFLILLSFCTTSTLQFFLWVSLMKLELHSSNARPAPKPAPTKAGHARRLKRRTEKTTPKERPREERMRREERQRSH